MSTNPAPTKQVITGFAWVFRSTPHPPAIEQLQDKLRDLLTTRGAASERAKKWARDYPTLTRMRVAHFKITIEEVK